MARPENHNFLPNIVGPWFPRRDGEESTKPYYYAAMLALLKPWRDLRQLKDDNESWESAFMAFIECATQRDKDVVAGSQYYYESRNVAVNREFEGESDEGANEQEDDQMQVDDKYCDDAINASVSVR